MISKKFTSLFRIAGSVVIISGGGWFVYQIYKTRYALSQTVLTDVINHNKKADYIYINDPDFQLMYERKRTFDQEGGTKEKRSWFASSFGFGRSLDRPYSWRLIAMTQNGNRNDRMKAVWLLANWKNMKDWDYQHLAQMFDARTAVGLARSEGVDLRFFLRPPNWHLSPSREALTDDVCSLLLALNNVKEHPCITFFLQKAFPELQYRHIVFDIDLATMELPRAHIRKDDILLLSIENLLHHSGIEDNAKDIVNLGGLPLIVNLCRHFEDDTDVTIKLVNLLSNISMQDGMQQHFFVTGCIGLLARWAQHPNIRLSIPATRALANLDVDDTPEIKFSSHLHLLYPTVRRIDLPKLDVVFIHGLLGGVFVTWRQRDREHTNMSGSQGHNSNDEPDIDRNVSDQRTKEYLQDVAEFLQDEWEILGSDFEMVLSDCPEKANSMGKGPYSYSGYHPCVRQSVEDCKTYSVCWPRDWLTQDCHHLRVIGVNYDTHLSMWAPMCPVESVKRSLEYRSNELLKKLKEAGLGSRPIVWVAHSMGGLLVKSVLTKACQDGDEQACGLCDNTKAVVFYSVPHRGSPVASLTHATQLLLWPSVEVQELRENPGIGEFFEIPQDHLCICKPSSRQSFLYQKLLHLIQKYLPGDN